MRALHVYLQLACLFSAAGLASFCLRRASTPDALRTYRAAFLACLFLVAAAPFLAPPAFTPPAAQIWSSPTWKTDPVPDRPWVSVASGGTALATIETTSALGWILLLAFMTARLGRDAFRLARSIRTGTTLRRVGKLSIVVSDGVPVPFSFAAFGRAYVVLPSALAERGKDFNLALRHELEHHRQRDTIWVYALGVVDSLFFWNPLVRGWLRHWAELHELSVDAALVRRVDAVPYARCLVRIAETVLETRRTRLACPLHASHDRGQLHRRIQTMLLPQERSRAYALFLPLVLVMLAGVACATASGYRDRRVTIDEARVLASSMSQDFPYVVNEHVVKHLDRFLGTPDGREYFKKSLDRMAQYRPMLDRKVAEFHVPRALLAVPIVESAYQNLAQDPQNKMHGAGLWMFIEPTAIAYGLRVDETVDERLNPEFLTDAAFRYLLGAKLQFKTWELALMAYNSGVWRIADGIRRFKTRDPWKLIENGVENDKEYLAKSLAAAIILQNPSALD